MKVAFIPIAFLLFAIPLPYFIDAILTLRLQLISSELGVSIIRLFGIPVYLDGNIIDMGTYKLQVVEACSGLRYLYPLLSLSFLAAYLFHGPIWQRVLVFLSSIPIAIGMNGLRIGLVGILVNRWGNQMAEGLLHFFEGWVIFLACSVILALEMYLLAALSGKGLFEVFYFPKIAADSPGAGKLRAFNANPLVAGLVLLCAGGFAVYTVSGRTELTQDRTRFVEFPQRMGQWQGRTAMLDFATEKALGFDDYLLSDYNRSDGRPVNLYVAYYASQRKGESPHSPIVCIPGGGWAITDIKQIDYVNHGESQPLNRVIIQKGDVKQLVYYWFDERGRKIANEWSAKFYLLEDAIMKNRTDGALVRVTTQVFPGETERDADARLESFMQAAVPQLSQFLPSELFTNTIHFLLAVRPSIIGTPWFSESIGLRSKVVTRFVILAGLALAGCSSKAEQAQSYYDHGQKLLAAHDTKGAALEFKNAIRLKNDFLPAYRGLAQIDETDHNWTELVPTLRRIVDLDPKDVDTRLKLARLMLYAGATDQALKLVNDLDASDNADLLALKGAISLRLKDSATAESDAQAALKIDPENVDARMILAADRLQKGDPQGALLILDSAKGTHANDLGVQLFKINIYQQLKNLPEVEALLNLLLRGIRSSRRFESSSSDSTSTNIGPMMRKSNCGRWPRPIRRIPPPLSILCVFCSRPKALLRRALS